jgi:hypothetical protein
LNEWKDGAQDIIHGQEDIIVCQSADIDLLKVREDEEETIKFITHLSL